jgi:hypothetical protein
MLGNWLLENKKGSNARAAESRARYVAECESFLASVEREVRSVQDFEDEHGLLPSEMYADPPGPSGARRHLTVLELHAPKDVHAAAVVLVERLEDWEASGARFDAYSDARAEFVRQFRRFVG